GVERRAAPVRAADDPRTLQRALHAGWSKYRAHSEFPHLGLRGRLQLRRRIERVVERHALLREGRRFHGNGLRRPGMLAFDIAWRNGPFFDRPYRLAGDAIEHVRISLLGELDDGVDRLSIRPNRDEVRRRRIVVVPEAMVN